MDDLLQYIDLDYYRSARLLIVRAEITQLRQVVSASSREKSPPIDDTSQRSCDSDAARLAQFTGLP